MPGDTAYPVKPGFSDPVYDAQRVFQLLQEAMAAPGVPVELDPVPVVVPLNAASMAICLAMLDAETPLWLDRNARLERLQQHLDYHCECPLVDDPAAARYALVSTPEHIPPLSTCGGIDNDGEEDTMLIVQVPTLSGIEQSAVAANNTGASRPLTIGGLPDDFWQQPGFQSGERQVDLIFTHSNRLIALPRSTRVVPS